jgi:hypothetical protein
MINQKDYLSVALFPNVGRTRAKLAPSCSIVIGCRLASSWGSAGPSALRAGGLISGVNYCTIVLKPSNPGFRGRGSQTIRKPVITNIDSRLSRALPPVISHLTKPYHPVSPSLLGIKSFIKNMPSGSAKGKQGLFKFYGIDGLS